MNYRHAFHAGNFADVVKHATVALMVSHLRLKDAGFFVLDTHAGLGAYDLAGGVADKTGEYKAGIARVLDATDPPDEVRPYLDAVRALNPDGGLRHYPGSPALVRGLLRPQDRLAAVELHPEDFAALKARFARDRQVTAHHMDGYEALKAMLPPPERRGLVLVDPPFEAKDEFARMARGLKQALKRWPTGLYALWYPIKHREPVAAFHAALAAERLPKTLAAELLVHPDDNPFRLNGSGLVLVNPPWKLDEALARLLPWLSGVLAPGGSWRAEWLVEEKS
ncbi:MAG: 23S rRNA (adenine(2030)-N(6))-methyltransferase RlmJ [Actinomycetota bacterium]